MNAVTVRAATILSQTSGFSTVMNLNREVFLDGFLITETHAHTCRRQIMVHRVQSTGTTHAITYAMKRLKKKLTTNILIVLKCIFTCN